MLKKGIPQLTHTHNHHPLTDHNTYVELWAFMSSRHHVLKKIFMLAIKHDGPTIEIWINCKSIFCRRMKFSSLFTLVIDFCSCYTVNGNFSGVRKKTFRRTEYLYEIFLANYMNCYQIAITFPDPKLQFSFLQLLIFSAHFFPAITLFGFPKHSAVSIIPFIINIQHDAVVCAVEKNEKQFVFEYTIWLGPNMGL